MLTYSVFMLTNSICRLTKRVCKLTLSFCILLYGTVDLEIGFYSLISPFLIWGIGFIYDLIRFSYDFCRKMLSDTSSGQSCLLNMVAVVL